MRKETLNRINQISYFASRFLGSRANLALFLFFFIASALLFAVSVDPMRHIYDEEMHWARTVAWHSYLGFDGSKLVGPFLPNSDMDGFIVYVPDFLAHLIQALTLELALQSGAPLSLVFLSFRVLNIGLHVSALLIIRIALKRMGVTSPIVGLSHWSYALMPMGVVVASTINYDNAAFFLFSLCLLGLAKFWNTPSLASLIPPVGFALMTLATKTSTGMAALIFVAIFMLWKGSEGVLTISGWRRRLVEVPTLGWLTLVSSLLVFSAGYLRLIVQTGSPLPSCDSVLELEVCQTSGIFNRNQELAALMGEPQPFTFRSAILYFYQHWLINLSYSSVITDLVSVTISPSEQAMVLSTLFLWIAPLALLAFPVILGVGQPSAALRATAAASFSFLLVAFLWNLSIFYQYGQALAVQYRYFMPVLFPLAAAMGAGLLAITRRSPFVRSLTVSLISLGIPILAMSHSGFLASEMELGWLLKLVVP